MNIVKIKGIIADIPVVNVLASVLLDFRMRIKNIGTGGWTDNHEDLLAYKLLTEKYNKDSNNMVYADIGTNNYRRNNNTYYLYKKGSHGICVEGNPLYIDSIKKHRTRDIVVNCLVGENTDEEHEFYVLSLPTRSTISKSSLDESLANGLKLKKTIKLNTKTLTQLFEENGINPDLLSIDIEGMDYMALRTLDLEKYAIKVIIVEKSEDIIDGKSIKDYLEEHNYCVEYENSNNYIFGIRL